MKNMTIGEVVFLIVGLVGAAFFIFWFFPTLQGYFTDATGKKPTLPTPSAYVAPFEQQQAPASKTELFITLPNQAA